MNRVTLLGFLAVVPVGIASPQSPASLQSAVAKALKPSVLRGVPSSFKDVHASVRNGVVTLSGSVDTYSTQLDAEVEVSRVQGVRGIQDDLRIAGPAVSDAVLQERVQQRVRNSGIVVEVHHGVVQLEGKQIDPMLAAEAFRVTAKTPGVQRVVNGMLAAHTLEANQAAPYTISSLP